MEIRDYLRLLLNHWRIIALLCLSAVVHVILVTYLLNDKYKTSTLVLITPQREVASARLTSEKQLLNFPVSPVGVSTQTETSTKTYGALIKSRPVIESVVRTLGLGEPPEQEDASYLTELTRGLKDGVKQLIAQSLQILKYGRVIERNPFDAAAAKVSSRVWVAPTRNSYVFAIECVWPNPQLAAAIANETARAFVELMSEISEGEARNVREFVEQRLNHAEAELARARFELREFKEQYDSIAFDVETVESIRLIAKLEGSLASTESKLSGQLAQFTPDTPKAVTLTPKVLTLQAERDRLAASIASRKRQLSRLPAAETRLATLQLNLRTAEQLYDVIALECEEARIREAKEMSDIRVVAPALVPTGPIKPIKIYYVAVALILALMVGVGGVLLLEVTNTTLRRVDEVEQALGVPVLTTIPHFDPPREDGR